MVGKWHVLFGGSAYFQGRTVRFSTGYPSGNDHMGPIKPESRKIIDSKVPAGRGYVSFREGLTGEIFQHSDMTGEIFPKNSRTWPYTFPLSNRKHTKRKHGQNKTHQKKRHANFKITPSPGGVGGELIVSKTKQAPELVGYKWSKFSSFKWPKLNRQLEFLFHLYKLRGYGPLLFMGFWARFVGD